MVRNSRRVLRLVSILAITGSALFLTLAAREHEAGSRSGNQIQAHRIQPGTRIVCGDNNLRPGEDCEGTNLAGQSCQSLGFATGSLSCTECIYDRSDCVPLVIESHPRMYISTDELEAIATRLDVEPWAAAYTELIAAANAALGQPALSVTSNGGQTSNAHQFATDNPYLMDGVYDPDADRGDYDAAMAISSAVVDLGLAYRFTGDERYAFKGIKLIRAWALDEQTNMVPEVENHGGGGNIEIFISVPGIFYGADLLWDSSWWRSGERDAFVEWVSAIGYSARSNGWGTHNNILFWKISITAAAGAFTNDATLLDHAFAEWRSELAVQVDSQGGLPAEISRTRSLSYSLFAMDAMSLTAEIARHKGVNLYDYTTQGKSLKLVFDFHAPFVANPGSWPHEMIGPHPDNEDLSAYELAYSYWQRPRYLTVFGQWERPIRNRFILDHSTLSHGNRFDLPQP